MTSRKRLHPKDRDDDDEEDSDYPSFYKDSALSYDYDVDDDEEPPKKKVCIKWVGHHA